MNTIFDIRLGAVEIQCRRTKWLREFDFKTIISRIFIKSYSRRTLLNSLLVEEPEYCCSSTNYRDTKARDCRSSIATQLHVDRSFDWIHEKLCQSLYCTCAKITIVWLGVPMKIVDREMIIYVECCKIIHDHLPSLRMSLFSYCFLTLSIADQQSLSHINRHTLAQLSIVET